MMAATVGHPMAIAVALLTVLWGCADHTVSIAAPEGKLEVLDISPGFSPEDLPRNWAVEGPGDVVQSQLAVVEKDGVKALKVANAKEGFVVARRTGAMLLATPFLSWSWNMEPHGSGFHPVRVVVGFYGGSPQSGGKGPPRTWLGSALPPHDRALTFIWGDSALQRGRLIKPAGRGRTAPLYVMRGGRENAGSWWLEAADLLGLYRRMWPGDNPGPVQVTFIGIASAGGHEPTAAYVSEIKLSR